MAGGRGILIRIVFGGNKKGKHILWEEEQWIDRQKELITGIDGLSGVTMVKHCIMMIVLIIPFWFRCPHIPPAGS